MEIKIQNNAIEEFFAKREEGDVDLVDIVAKYLTTSNVSADNINYFLTHPDVVSIKDNKSVVQKVILNKFFQQQLLIYRTKSGVSVMDILIFLTNEGNVNQWVNLFQTFVLPFLIANNVFNVIRDVK